MIFKNAGKLSNAHFPAILNIFDTLKCIPQLHGDDDEICKQ